MVAAKKVEPPPPPPRTDEPTGAAGEVLVAFVAELMTHHLPIGKVQAEVERSTGPLVGLRDESQPIGMLARRLADRLVADMEIETPNGGSNGAS